MNQSTEMLLKELLENFLKENPIRETITIVIKPDNTIIIGL